jgi:Protein of unknown function (DUF1549)/Protein of unknown function (DUF1553)
MQRQPEWTRPEWTRPRTIGRPALLGCCLLGLCAWWQPALARGSDAILPASQRFAKAGAAETPDFRRHVLPMLGRQGCNGRACHGSFQGQGGFRLSLFGYDFQADHEALTGGEEPRANRANPRESLILQKPTMAVDHEGGERFPVDSWQYRLLLRWIESGAKGLPENAAELSRLEVMPAEIIFHRAGEQTALRVVAHWSDGTSEDVTCLSRFRTNDDAVATVDETGSVTASGKGDTHVVVFYDNGVHPVNVLLPVSDRVGANYPVVPAPSKLDELVVAKLRKLGIVPSELSTDTEFLRRVSLDLTGTLPRGEEVTTFTADNSPDKRARKIDELLERPGYAAWWTTKLCDFTGNSVQQLNQTGLTAQDSAREWYQWMHRRVRSNMPYDKLVEGIVLATGREPGQDYGEYCRQTSECYHPGSSADFAQRTTMPHFWARRNVRRPEEKALSFCYSFLGVHLQCAQCHKHPFDQWTKPDFDQFSAFFTRINYGLAPDARAQSIKMQKELGLGAKKGNQLKRELPALLKEGKVVPWQEVFVAPARGGQRNAMQKKKPDGKASKAPPPMLAKLLGGDVVELAATKDPRQALMDWMRRDPERYFARALVNRVWAAYFGLGIVDPPDDLNLANPPSNPALLDYLTHGFVEHGFDMKWLHREIANSRTYQLSWRTNETNQHDDRNFSHALQRRMPAEVAYDAIVQATAGDPDIASWRADLERRAIGLAGAVGRGKGGGIQYALTVFGKPTRETNCDCERSAEPSLLQTVYLRNDGEMLALIDRAGAWLKELGGATRAGGGRPFDQTQAEPDATSKDPEVATQRVARLEVQLAKLKKKGKQEQAAVVLARLEKARHAVALGHATAPKASVEVPVAQAAVQTKAPSANQSAVATRLSDAELVRQAYLRTVSRPPTAEELARAGQHLHESTNRLTGLRDLLWALLNTKEFIVNH